VSRAPELRRTDRAMSESEIGAALARGRCGRVSSVSADGWPYCLPLLYVWVGGRIYVHGTSAVGHLRQNIRQCDKVCFEIDEADEVFPYGRFECDTTLAYSSVIAFGRMRVVEDTAGKQQFLDALMAKYADPAWERPRNFYPRIDAITVYAIDVERITGKQIVLPTVSQRWPARDRSMTPNAQP
jgi:uncharacterized protein